MPSHHLIPLPRSFSSLVLLSTLFLLLGLLSSAGASCGNDQMLVLLTMWDSWGDGWNGNTLEFYDQAGENQVPNTGSYFVLPSERKNAANREVCLSNQCFSIVVGGGSYTNEISWR